MLFVAVAVDVVVIAAAAVVVIGVLHFCIGVASVAFQGHGFGRKLG